MEIGEEIVVYKGKYKYVSRKMRKSIEKYLKKTKEEPIVILEQRKEMGGKNETEE